MQIWYMVQGTGQAAVGVYFLLVRQGSAVLRPAAKLDEGQPNAGGAGDRCTAAAAAAFQAYLRVPRHDRHRLHLWRRGVGWCHRRLCHHHWCNRHGHHLCRWAPHGRALQPCPYGRDCHPWQDRLRALLCLHRHPALRRVAWRPLKHVPQVHRGHRVHWPPGCGQGCE